MAGGGEAQVAPDPERVEDHPLVTNDWSQGALVAGEPGAEPLPLSETWQVFPVAATAGAVASTAIPAGARAGSVLYQRRAYARAGCVALGTEEERAGPAST